MTRGPAQAIVRGPKFVNAAMIHSASTAAPTARVMPKAAGSRVAA